jgi:hypothetical protein
MKCPEIFDNKGLTTIFCSQAFIFINSLADQLANSTVLSPNSRAGCLPVAATSGCGITHIAYPIAISVELKGIGCYPAVISGIGNTVTVRIYLVLTDGLSNTAAKGH